MEARYLFTYLCDKCDCAGFWEIDSDRAAYDTGLSVEAVNKALDSLDDKIVRGSRFIWIKNFLFHQRNLPLNHANKAHRAIVRRLEEFRGFSQEIDALLGDRRGFIEGDQSPPGKGKGIGIGIGTGNGSVSVSENKEKANEVIDLLNSLAGSKFRHSDHQQENITARLADGFTLDDCKAVVEFKVFDWLHDPEMSKYLTPTTLFRPTKFEGNLNAARRWIDGGRQPLSQQRNRSSPRQQAATGSGEDYDSLVKRG
jgi:uncharacterized phage protein (TIGR02220 family)